MEKTYLNKNCPFCSVLEGEIKEIFILYKDNVATAFLSNMPVNRGHTIIIPNAHYVNSSSLPEDVCGRMYFTAIRIGVAAKRALDSSGYNILSSDGFCSGQDIQHAHIHLIPRYTNDGWHLNWRTIKDSNMSKTSSLLLSRLKF